MHKWALGAIARAGYGRTVEKMIYVDGGGDKKQGDADLPGSWVITVFDVDEKNRWKFAGYVTGLVEVSPGHEQYVGADSRTCGAAELTSQCWTALYILSQNSRWDEN
jgi:hypothetical protein